jgi:hypothetical protein
VGLPDAVAARFLDEALCGELAAATRTILRADELGVPLVRLFGDVLRPALVEVGARWAHGILPVGQEKEVSAGARLADAFPRSRAPTS